MKQTVIHDRDLTAEALKLPQLAHRIGVLPW